MASPFPGWMVDPPEGPKGTDVEHVSISLPTPGARIKLYAGSMVEVEGGPTILRKLRICAAGETYGMVQYPDGGLLWIELAPAPTPGLTEAQKEALAELKRKIPRRYWIDGDSLRRVGERKVFQYVNGPSRRGTIVFMATLGPGRSAAAAALDDGAFVTDWDLKAMAEGLIRMEEKEGMNRE